MDLITTQGFLHASPDEVDAKTNGAGPEGLGRLVPDTIWLFCINQAANRHDWMYEDVENGKDMWAIKHHLFGSSVVYIKTSKGFADMIFLINMLMMIDQSGGFWPIRWLRRYRAMTYFNFVKDVGGFAIKKPKKKGKGTIMRKITLFLALISILVFVFGCGRRPEQVSAAETARNSAVKMYVANDNAADAFLIEKYKESELKRVSLAYALKMKELQAAVRADLEKKAKATGGRLSFTPAQASYVFKQIEKKKEAILLKRDIMREKVNQVTEALYRARERNKINLAIASKLHAAVEDFDAAGIDMTAAQKSIDSIFLLLQKHNILDTGKAPRPPVILPTPEQLRQPGQ